MYQMTRLLAHLEEEPLPDSSQRLVQRGLHGVVYETGAAPEQGDFLSVMRGQRRTPREDR